MFISKQKYFILLRCTSIVRLLQKVIWIKELNEDYKKIANQAHGDNENTLWTWIYYSNWCSISRITSRLLCPLNLWLGVKGFITVRFDFRNLILQWPVIMTILNLMSFLFVLKSEYLARKKLNSQRILKHRALTLNRGMNGSENISISSDNTYFHCIWNVSTKIFKTSFLILVVW